MTGHHSSTPIPTSSSPPSWTSGAVVVAVGVGVGLLLLWRLWRGCRRRLQMGVAVVGASPSDLYRFLCDPQNLKIIHPHTTEIRQNSETEEEGGATVKEFDWVEKVPFTVISTARMRCDPATSTITIDIVPAGNVHQVQLKWQLKPLTSLSEEKPQQTDNPQEQPLSTDKITSKVSADDDRMTTSGRGLADDQKTEKDSTEFHNHIEVTGPSGVVFVVTKIIVSIQKKLMERMQAHFKDLNK